MNLNDHKIILFFRSLFQSMKAIFSRNLLSIWRSKKAALFVARKTRQFDSIKIAIILLKLFFMCEMYNFLSENKCLFFDCHVIIKRYII